MHVKPEQGFRPIDVLNTLIELRHSKVKYKFVFYKASSPPSPSSLLKLPIVAAATCSDWSCACLKLPRASACSVSFLSASNRHTPHEVGVTL